MRGGATDEGLDDQMTSRIERRFAALAKEQRKAFVAFVTAGDPDYATSEKILHGLPAAGADVIELGMPFSDPMADGPAVQASSLRALKSGQTMRKTLELVRGFRKRDPDTPIVLMGYYNPDLRLSRASLPRRRQGRRRRRPHHRRPAARGRRGAVPAGRRARPQLHPPRHADHGRQAAAGRARQHLGLPLLRLHHRHHRHGRARRRRGPRPYRPHPQVHQAPRGGRLRRHDPGPGQGALRPAPTAWWSGQRWLTPSVIAWARTAKSLEKQRPKS